MAEINPKIIKFKALVEESPNIVFFGGAGVSTESGIPDFRSKDGLYNQHDVQFDMYQPEYLLSHRTERDGKQTSMVEIKGAPETFDLDALTRAVKKSSIRSSFIRTSVIQKTIIRKFIDRKGKSRYRLSGKNDVCQFRKQSVKPIILCAEA